MLKLYQSGNSICTQKVLITLDEKGLDYGTRNINLFTHEQYSPDYLKINPKGVVPSLDHDGHIIVESTLICEYLDDMFPEPPLTPADAYGRARMRLWSKAIDEGIFEATRELSFSAMFREKMKAMSEEQRQTRFRNVGDPSRTARFKSTYELGVESPYVFEAIATFEKLFKNMEHDLSEGGPWMLGPDYSLADINLMPYVARVDYLDLLDIWVAERPHVRAWWARAQERPSFKVAVSEKLTGDDIAAMKTYGGAIRERVRERRDEYLASINDKTK